MFDKIKKIILENSEEKVFGCIHCKEDSELCIDNISLIADEIKKLFDAELKELQHHRATTVGLYAIDFEPKGLIKRFVDSQSDATRLVVEDVEDLIEDWILFIDDKNMTKSPFFRIS